MYSWDPNLYSSNSKAQKSWGLELLSKVDLKGTENVLDVGCGDGKLSAEIAGKVPEGSVLGIDLSEDMIAYARNKYPPEQFPNLSFLRMDANALTFDSDFDIIYSNAALHWIKAPQAALKKFWESLKPDGVLLAQFGGRGNAAEVLKTIDLMLADNKWSPYFKDFEFPYGFYSPEEYGKWLEAAGFAVKRLEILAKDMALEGEKGLFSWIGSTWHPYTQQVPAELKEDFIKDLVGRFIVNNPPDEKGYIHIRMVRLEIESYRKK